MTKFTVICGPELTNDEAWSKIPSGVLGLVLFPEQDMGAEQVRKTTTRWVLDNHDVGITFVTRYDMIPNELGGLIADGKISKDEVSIHLCRQGAWSVHNFTEEGYMENSWPFGVLS